MPKPKKGTKFKLATAIKQKRGFIKPRFTLKQVAEQSGVDINSVYRAETGSKVGAAIFIKLCDWLDLDPRNVEIG